MLLLQSPDMWHRQSPNNGILRGSVGLEQRLRRTCSPRSSLVMFLREIVAGPDGRLPENVHQHPELQSARTSYARLGSIGCLCRVATPKGSPQ